MKEIAWKRVQIIFFRDSSRKMTGRQSYTDAVMKEIARKYVQIKKKMTTFSEIYAEIWPRAKILRRCDERNSRETGPNKLVFHFQRFKLKDCQRLSILSH